VKFHCDCGHVIRDQTDNLPYKASLVRDREQWEFAGGIRETVASFLHAVLDGRRNEWIAANMGYSPEMADESVVSDLICRFEIRHMTNVYECEQCGRLFVAPKSAGEPFFVFIPAQGRYCGALGLPPAQGQ
jgi:hypothetical protein